MSKIYSRETKIGILGGGQLGRMLCEAASPLDLELHVMDATEHHPAARMAPHYRSGDINSYEDVLSFGEELDILTIEIEQVNTEALFELKKRGVHVLPDPEILSTIQDKGRQKSWYRDHDFPTSPFVLVENLDQAREMLEEEVIEYPFVQKVRTEGYDGRGVEIIEDKKDLENRWLEGASVMERKIDIHKELAVIVVRNAGGDISLFPPVEMDFHGGANLLDHLACPAEISPNINMELRKLSKNLVMEWDYEGILAIEYFLSNEGELLINEVAPRPHNSGHHTIEACTTSQFSQHIRALLNWPLGATDLLQSAVMVNLLGEQGTTGPTKVEGLPMALETSDVYVHLYGKRETRPNRKMGHVTALADSTYKALSNAREAASLIKVTT